MAGATIIAIGGTLIVTLHDDAASTEADDLMALVCGRIVAHAANNVVIDIAPLSMVDSYLARTLGGLAAAGRLLGAETILAGMRPEVAIAMVELGTDLPGLRTAMNVELAMAALGPHHRPSR
ncbi:STAS domain-containing protein [Roseomonas frigidaquae]|uniref:STAS domain-containing protein n=1 Tax=Falsiroseomonas frigidaquae TaxID=487318 RepID=A0ABX1F1U3_9PROT|nr:STAS domain-containing protein [Falsiroseomonas frigidaquae]NKE46310.1 STAS domain-containing protein [Falsiroseomonas frigidaquae]